jgi:pimeloyl-ACP methyl ester carboxylesterase
MAANDVQARKVGRWANDAAGQTFRDLYDALGAEVWPAPPEERDVETAIGTAHVFRWPGRGMPVVLLHGAGTSSLMWAPLLAHLHDLPLVAIDLIGEPGMSTQRVAMRDVHDLCASLEQVFDAIGVDRMHLVGASYGGYVALHYTTETAARVDTLTLLEPVLEKVRPWFWLHGALCGVALATPAPVRRRLARALRVGLLATDDKRVRRFGVLGQTKFRRGAPPVVPVTDEQLAAVAVRTLVLLGEKSQVHRAKPLLARLHRVAPALHAEIVRDAGHSLPVDQAEFVASKLRTFLACPA